MDPLYAIDEYERREFKETSCPSYARLQWER